MFVRPQYIAALTALALTFLASSAFARSFRVDQTPGSDYGCELCHLDAGGLNDFGFDSFQFVDNGDVIWSNLAAEDSDGDGYTNGEELGDPDGSWMIGDAIPGGQTDPNDANTDDGGVNEGVEVDQDGTDPNYPSDDMVDVPDDEVSLVVRGGACSQAGGPGSTFAGLLLLGLFVGLRRRRD